MTDTVTLLNTDCMEYMATLPDNHFSIAVVDPPYGIDINMNMGLRAGKRADHKVKSWDKSTPDDAYFDELMRVSVNQIIWGGNYFPLPLTKSWIFWDKHVPDGVDFADGELAWTSYSKTLVKAKIKYTGFQGMDIGGKIHPTQKPVALYSWIFKNYTQHGDTILDTHLGSGSSAIAAQKLGGVKFVGCELDTEYFDAACKRFKEQTMQQDMFR